MSSRKVRRPVGRPAASPIHFVAGHRCVLKPALKMALAIAKLLFQALAVEQLQGFRRIQRRRAGADRASLHVQNATLLVSLRLTLRISAFACTNFMWMQGFGKTALRSIR